MKSSAVGFGLLLMSGVFAALQLLGLPSSFEAAVALARTWYVPLLVAGLGLAIVGISGRPVPFSDRTRLSFGTPYVAAREVIAAETPRASLSIHGSRATSPTEPETSFGSNTRVRLGNVEVVRTGIVRQHVYVPVENKDESRDARGARFTVWMYAAASGEAECQLVGRWADSPQIIEGVHPRDVKDILPVPSQRLLTADIAFQDETSDALYAFNTETTVNYPDWKDPNKRLSPPSHWVRIRVTAENTAALEGWFEMFNGPTGGVPSIRTIPRPGHVRT